MSGNDGKGVEFVVNLPEELKARLHITAATRGSDVPPVEAKDLVATWRKDPAKVEADAVELKDVWVRGRIAGLFN